MVRMAQGKTITPLRNCCTFSVGFRRRNTIETERSSSVSASRPIIAMAAGVQVENCLGS